jgi:hypothetical protein
MKRFVISVVLFCLALPVSLAARDKKPVADMKNMNHVFLGWVALDPEEAYDLGYSKAEWEDVISHENVKFQEYFNKQCTTGSMVGVHTTSTVPRFQTITGAKDSKDEKTSGNDLYIKFSDVSFSTGYVLNLSAHFINLKTNTEVASIPSQKYRAHVCGLVGCLEQELDELNQKLQKQLSCKLADK